jgi:internalin A
MRLSKTTVPFLLALALIAPTLAWAQEPVVFKDPMLEAVVREALSIPTDPIMPADMLNLEWLEARRRGIKDLTGLQYATNLVDAKLDMNRITDLSPLAPLTALSALSVSANQVSDITPLSGLSNLVILLLDGNPITNIDPLARLTNLQSLDLTRTQVTDIGPLAGLSQMYMLSLQMNPQIADFSVIGTMPNLQYLVLGFNGIADIQFLAGLTGLIELNLAGNQISDISPLAGLANLQNLIVANNQVQNISVVAGMPQLFRLSLDHNWITDISALAGLTQLTWLTLQYNQISDITPLASIAGGWTTLDLESNQISDVSPLAGLTNLRTLGLAQNQIRDISPLEGLTNLLTLSLQYNQIVDVSPLSGMTNLTDLRLWANQVRDVEPLSLLTNLRQLHISHNPVGDISSLGNLVNVTYLSISASSIADISVVQYMTRLETLLSYETQVSDLGPLTALTTLRSLQLGSCPLSWESYCLWLPTIQANNPGLTDLQVDPNPYNCACQPEPTPEGPAVGVTPTDNTTGTTPMTVTFEQVTAAGGTTLVTTTSGPTPPPGFQLGDPATYYSVTTTADYTGLIDVCISYADVSFPGPPEALRLFHYESGQWLDCTTMVDTQNQTVCGVVTSLSPFAIMAPEDTTPPVFQSLTATPNVLWPPSHKLVPVVVAWNVTDNLDPDPIVALKSITMNEDDEANTYDPTFDTTMGDGHTVGDIEIDATGNIFLRAERTGTGTGRTYTLTYQATDALGNTAAATVIVTVPHEAP